MLTSRAKKNEGVSARPEANNRQPGSDATLGIAGRMNRQCQLAPGPPDLRIGSVVVIRCLIQEILTCLPAGISGDREERRHCCSTPPTRARTQDASMSTDSEYQGLSMAAALLFPLINMPSWDNAPYPMLCLSSAKS